MTTRRADIFNCQNNEIMEQQTSNERQSRVDAQNAALMLLDDYVKQHSREFARAMTGIVPFINYECTHDGLGDCVSTLNTAVAVMALEVIQDFYEMDFDDPDRRILPCGSDDLKDAVQYLTRFISKTRTICNLLSNGDVPAIDMCRKAYYEGLRRK
jgi:hypothetical protein